jgi:serine/threonine-protein kinase HipA
MGRRTHTRQLILYMNGDLVGTWRLTPKGEELQYANSWLESPRRRPISLKFPLTPDAELYSGIQVHDYFENLLPDTKAIRERLAQRFKTGSISAFPLLAELGRDCVGALQIVPEGTEPPDVEKVLAVPLSDTEIAKLLRETVTVSDRFGSEYQDDDFRISIAGAQEKTALLWYENKWCRPLGATPTTHILKLPLGLVGNMQADMTNSVENEWLCSKILAAYGLPVAQCEIQTFEDQKVLIVERFDRRQAQHGEWLLRLPQEDMCQATGTSYLKKYQKDGGPGIDQIMNLLSTAEDGLNDKRTFFTCQIIFWLLAATDGHAKNFSIHLKQGGTYSLTPFYDVLSAYPVMGIGKNLISPRKAKLAMGVKGKNMHNQLYEIQRRHWNIAASRNGLVHGGEDIINSLIKRTPEVIAKVQAQLPAGFPEVVAGSVFAGMQGAADNLRNSPVDI